MRRLPTMLFAGEFWSGASGAGLSQGFRDLGWAVQEVDYGHFRSRPSGNLALRVASRLTRGVAENAYRDRLLQTCRILKPDVFLTIKGVAVTRDLLREVRRMGVLTAMYYPDVDFDHPGVTTSSFTEYDLFVTTKTFQVEHLTERLGAGRVLHVPHGYVPAVHRPVYDDVTDESPSDDVAYIGSHSAYKQRWLEDFAMLAPDIRLSVTGSRWNQAVAGGSLSSAPIREEVTEIAYAAAIQNAKINIALHFGKRAGGWEDRVSTRSFEIPACKGFMLHIDNEEIRSLYDVGSEIDVFATPGELVEKARFYLARPDLRRAMIERAYQRCVPAYSFGARAAEIAHALTVRVPGVGEAKVQRTGSAD